MAIKEQLAAIRNENIKLKKYIATITQLGRCKVRIENNKKMKICSFFVRNETLYKACQISKH